MKGSSSANWVSFMGGPPTDFTYPRVIERELLRAGRQVVVRNLAQTSEPVNHGLKNWEPQVYPWSPDVVVLNYGLFESVHLFLPRFLERHAHSLRGRPGPVRHVYRRFVLRPVWQALARVQQRVDSVAPPILFARRARRFADDLEELIQRLLTIGSPLVLVCELPPAGERWRTWFPGINGRLEQVNAAAVEAVRRIDRPEVRLFPTKEALAELVAEGHDIVPDGGHFTPAAHHALGSALAREILAWFGPHPVPLSSGETHQGRPQPRGPAERLDDDARGRRAARLDYRGEGTGPGANAR